jgi:geranylgeranyl pyrophosphate synthase
MLQRRGKATLEEALLATRLKSGALGKFVTGFAARVAGGNGDAVALFERFGEHTFTLAQIIDDLRDANLPGQASDLAQRKATLPVVFYHRRGGSAGPADAKLADITRQAYESSGAPLYAAILAEVYLARAQKDLSSLARHGYAIAGLVEFLGSLESSAGGILGAAVGGLVA